MVDLGTGDGGFVLDQARRHPDALVVGIDAAASGMDRASRKAAGRPERGGLANALFVLASIESACPSLDCTADRVTINYPWGSLLRAVAVPEIGPLGKIAGLLKPGGEIVLLLNLHPFADAALVSRLGLAGAAFPNDRARLHNIYEQAGLRITQSRLATIAEARATTWGKQLVAGGREIMRMTAVRTG